MLPLPSPLDDGDHRISFSQVIKKIEINAATSLANALEVYVYLLSLQYCEKNNCYTFFTFVAV